MRVLTLFPSYFCTEVFCFILKIMFSKTWDFVHKLYNGRRENFLIIEQFNGSYEVTRAFRNLKKKEITIVKSVFNKESFGSLKRPIKKADK